MSHLWACYYADNVDKFRRLLAPSAYGGQAAARSPNIGTGGGSFGSLGTSPRAGPKPRKVSGFGANLGVAKQGGGNVGKNEVNGRDYAGLTLLLRAASSTSPNALAFVQALLDHPAIDIYAQDLESGWNALHRALYAGNISIARALLEKERRDLMGQTLGAPLSKIGQLIKTKDHEGNSPFNLYHSITGREAIKKEQYRQSRPGDDEEETGETSWPLQGLKTESNFESLQSLTDGNDLYFFGSNKNLTLGLGDEDDRQFPERIYLKRPDHLIHRFYDEYLLRHDKPLSTPSAVSEIPALLQNRPLLVHDVVLSKLHSAVLTADPVSNLYVCGVGRGGRLGLGDENTRFEFTPVQGGLKDQRVTQIALGQNHTMAVTDLGHLWTWGSNTFSQLGYALPTPAKSDEDPISTIPRQIFGPLKKERIRGVAASAIHSVAHTGTSLYCWGKNVGQLALMDANSRSLEVQQIPRKVAASLFSAPIAMVSAIDKATSCLLDNYTVWVFTSYGYNVVKFPFSETLGNYQLGDISMSSRYDPGRNRITHITSGGETIAAVTGRGDLFTLALTNKGDSGQSATSTTNPSKVKNALTQPQCIWTARKDGVRSVGVGEHGSVIISTESGAVWRRIKRSKAKDPHVGGPSDARKKDFKFQRVPYITNAVTVRSSVFGAFAAVRKDSDFMRKHIVVGKETLAHDLAPLMSLQDFRTTERSSHNDSHSLEFWAKYVEAERISPLAFEVLTSPNLGADLKRYLTDRAFGSESLGTAVRTSIAPDLQIPVHSWVLAARSSVLRAALVEYGRKRSYRLQDIFTIEEEDGTTVVTFHGLELISLLNLVVYMYEDKVIPAWHYTRQSSPLAAYYRQVRVEVMRISSRLNMPLLEAAARIQTAPKSSLQEDFKSATRDPSFFEDGDTLLELDGGEVTVHSAFLCRRCPWFQGLFNGRSGGRWLAGRRQGQNPAGKVKLDLKHMDPDAFRYVLQYLYADLGEELFDSVVLPSFDDFCDLVMDVMSIANELMLDRLSQICQYTIARFANTRNISHLLNAISPCAVTEFKDAGLRYICLQMETMLENHFLDDLDEDLMLELDSVVRSQQIAGMPFAKSERAELELHERHPELAQDIDEERQRRIREMAFKTSQREDERKLSTSLRSRFGSLDDITPATPSPDRARRKSRTSRNEPFSPDLRPKASQADLIFDMDDEDTTELSSSLPNQARARETRSMPLQKGDAAGLRPSPEEAMAISPVSSPALGRLIPPSTTPTKAAPEAATSKTGNPWGSPGVPMTKLDLREIMTETTTPGSSALSAGLAAQKGKEAAAKATPTKMSQKERKKQQQQQMQAFQAATQEASTAQSNLAWETANTSKRPPPWKAVPQPGPRVSLRDGLSGDSKPVMPVPNTKPLVAAETSSQSIPRRTASPDTRFAGQTRTPSTSAVPSPARPSTDARSSTPLVPHSRCYIKPASKAEASLGLSMADIMGQQTRERESVKEAVAKRSLQEIQQEQAFQEWWDQESRRAQEEEARRATREKEKEEGKGRRQRGRANRSRGGGAAGGGRGGGGSGSGSGGHAQGEAAGATNKGRGRVKAS